MLFIIKPGWIRNEGQLGFGFQLNQDIVKLVTLGFVYCPMNAEIIINSETYRGLSIVVALIKYFSFICCKLRDFWTYISFAHYFVKIPKPWCSKG